MPGTSAKFLWIYTSQPPQPWMSIPPRKNAVTATDVSSFSQQTITAHALPATSFPATQKEYSRPVHRHGEHHGVRLQDGGGIGVEVAVKGAGFAGLEASLAGVAAAHVLSGGVHSKNHPRPGQRAGGGCHGGRKGRAAKAGVPRVFSQLGQPGWVSARKMVCLPMWEPWKRWRAAGGTPWKEIPGLNAARGAALGQKLVFIDTFLKPGIFPHGSQAHTRSQSGCCCRRFPSAFPR